MIKYFVDWDSLMVWEVSDFHDRWMRMHPKAVEVDIHEYLALKSRIKNKNQ